MIKKIQLILFISSNFAISGNGKVILLLGTSTAGKTTIIEKIKKRHPDILDYGSDIAIASALKRLVKENAFNDYNLLGKFVNIEKLPELLQGEKFWLNKNLSQTQIIEVDATIKRIKNMIESWDSDGQKTENSIYDLIFEEAQNGKSVITDLVSLESFERFSKKKKSAPLVPVYVFITYCSLHRLSRRMQVRNQKAESAGIIGDKRIGFPLMQFASLYKKRTSAAEPLLGSLKRRDVDIAFALHYPNNLNKKMEFLKALEFTSNEMKEIDITTRFSLGEAKVIDTGLPTTKIVATIESAVFKRGKGTRQTPRRPPLPGP